MPMDDDGAVKTYTFSQGIRALMFASSKALKAAVLCAAGVCSQRGAPSRGLRGAAWERGGGAASTSQRAWSAIDARDQILPPENQVLPIMFKL